MNYEQFKSAVMLQQWIELHQFQPCQPVRENPRAWWPYAVKCLTGNRSGQQHRQTAAWDFSRVRRDGA